METIVKERRVDGYIVCELVDLEMTRSGRIRTIWTPLSIKARVFTEIRSIVL